MSSTSAGPIMAKTNNKKTIKEKQRKQHQQNQQQSVNILMNTVIVYISATLASQAFL